LEFKHIQPIIIITKMDLANDKSKQQLEKFKNNYEEMGYTVFFHDFDSQIDIKSILQHIKDEVTVLVGQSGVGKSTLLNLLHPILNLDTNEISMRLGRGKHTTRHVELMKVNHGLIADTPGFSSLEFTEIEAEQLADC